MIKGTPEQLKAAIQDRIAELSQDDIESSAAITGGWAASDDSLFKITDECMGVVGDILTYDDVQQLFHDSEGEPETDAYHGDFDSWLYDTVNGGYLRPINAATNTCNISGQPVFGYDDDFDDDWVELASKSVKDSDGFITDYTLYRYDGDPDDVEFPYLCMFGDKELYEPGEGHADWLGETEEEAWDWFENYHGFEDDDDLGYTTDAPIKSSSNPEDYLDDFNDAWTDVSTDIYDVVDLDALYEIAERYNTSDPVSGDWDTETAHEQQAISDELGISMEDAKQLMIDELGFEPEMFDANVTSATNINCSCTATQIVKSIYNQFPEVEFIDENDLGDKVRLKFNVPKTFDKHTELESYLNECGCPYTLFNTVLRVDAPEDDFYK